MKTPTHLSDGSHVLVPDGGTARTVEVSQGGDVLVDGEDTYIWNEDRDRYECGDKVLRFWVEGQVYGIVDTSTWPPYVETGTWS
jgi:hypothetical protein